MKPQAKIFWSLLLLLILIWVCCSCQTTAYWRMKNKAGIERYEYNKPGWPYEIGCQAYYTKQPIKRSTMKKQFYGYSHK